MSFVFAQSSCRLDSRNREGARSRRCVGETSAKLCVLRFTAQGRGAEAANRGHGVPERCSALCSFPSSHPHAGTPCDGRVARAQPGRVQRWVDRVREDGWVGVATGREYGIEQAASEGYQLSACIERSLTFMCAALHVRVCAQCVCVFVSASWSQGGTWYWAAEEGCVRARQLRGGRKDVVQFDNGSD